MSKSYSNKSVKIFQKVTHQKNSRLTRGLKAKSVRVSKVRPITED